MDELVEWDWIAFTSIQPLCDATVKAVRASPSEAGLRCVGLPCRVRRNRGRLICRDGAKHCNSCGYRSAFERSRATILKSIRSDISTGMGPLAVPKRLEPSHIRGTSLL